MSFEVLLTYDAERDIGEICGYIAAHDSPAKAKYLLDRIEEVVKSLEEFPDRGVCPRELASVGISEYREVFFKPYRLIYRVIGNRVYVYLVADGRRDMQTLLQRRLLSS